MFYFINQFNENKNIIRLSGRQIGTIVPNGVV